MITDEMRTAEGDRRDALDDAQWDMKYLKNGPPSEEQIKVMLKKLMIGSHVGRIGV